MSARALFCEGIIAVPYWEAYWEPKRRTTSANSTLALGGPTLGSSMAGPPSFEETRGGLLKQLAELVPQRFGQMRINLRRSQGGMAEQDLDDADVHALLEHVRGKTVAERVRPEVGIKAALLAGLHEGGPRGRVAEVGQHTPTGKEPLRAAVGLPHLAQHVQDRFR